GTVATIFTQQAPPQSVPSRPESTAQDGPPLLLRRNRPGQRTSDARGRRSDHFGKRGEVHPEAHASRSRPIRSRLAANSWRGTAASASWKTRYFACDTTSAPILIWRSKATRRGSLWLSPIGFLCRFGRKGQKRWGFQGFGANVMPKAEVPLGNVVSRSGTVGWTVRPPSRFMEECHAGSDQEARREGRHRQRHHRHRSRGPREPGAGRHRRPG